MKKMSTRKSYLYILFMALFFACTFCSPVTAKAEGHYLQGFNVKEDVFNFTNSEEGIGVNAGDKYQVPQSALDALFSHYNFSLEDRETMTRRLQSFGGVCGAMTSLVIQNYYGLIDLSTYRADHLNEIKRPAANKELKRLIGLNDIVQSASKYWKAQNEFMMKYRDNEPIELLYNMAMEIDKRNEPIYIDVAWVTDPETFNFYEETGGAAHALMVYGIETSEEPYVVDGKSYAYRLLIVDPNVNYVKEKMTEDNYIYISENLEECIIPDTGSRSEVSGDFHQYNNGRMINYNDFIFQLITTDVSVISPKGSVEYSDEVRRADLKKIHEYITSEENFESSLTEYESYNVSFTDLGIDYTTEDGYYSKGKNGYEFIKVTAVSGNQVYYKNAHPVYDDMIGHSYYDTYGSTYTAECAASTRFYTGNYQGAHLNILNGNEMKESKIFIVSSLDNLHKECLEYPECAFIKIVDGKVEVIVTGIVFVV